MAKFTRYLCLSLLFSLLPGLLLGRGDIYFKGDYFLYSDQHNYIYGSGKVTMKRGTILVEGDVLYMDVESLQGVIYGRVRLKEGAAEKSCHALFFTAFPLEFLCENFLDKITREGGLEIKDILEKRAPTQLKKSDICFEFREFRINKYGRIKAKYIIPYVMGLPTVPIKSFPIRRGKTPEKTTISFKNLSIFGLDGLSVTFVSRLREKFASGDFDLKLYERELMNVEGPKRGVILSGKSDFLAKKKPFLTLSTLANSGEQSFNVNVSHNWESKYVGYSISQAVSGRENTPVFFNFGSRLTVKKLALFAPSIDFSHDLKRSYSYGISTPIHIWKKMAWNVGWQRKILKGNFASDTSDFSTSLAFTSSLIDLSTNYNVSKNMLDAALRQNFSVNLKFATLSFLDKNVSIDLSSFYMFSAMPTAGESITRSTPGVNLVVTSAGALLPLGFSFVPSFSLNHIWDNREQDYTDFNYLLSLEKAMGRFKFSLAYALTSRYKADNFWVEGSSQQNMNVILDLSDPQKYAFNLRFYFNDDLALENISFSGRVHLGRGFSFSSFALYYQETDRLHSLELFVEKQFMNSGKIQGGYSLALKRFFLRFVSM